MTELLPKNRTDALKGISAVMVLICHLHRLVEGSGNGENYFFNALGYLSVAVFFLLSGYGVYLGTQTKPHYLRTFLPRRIFPVYLANAFLVLIYTLENQLFIFLYTGSFYLGKADAKDILCSFFLFGETVIYGWYFQVIVILYVLFFAAFVFGGNNRTKILLLGVLMAAYYAIVGLYCGESAFQWFATTPCFFFGVVLGAGKTQAEKFLMRQSGKKIMLYAVCFLVLSAGFIALGISHVIPLSLFWKYTCGTCCYLLMWILLLWRFDWSNKVFLFLGKYSLEIYGLQGMGFLLVRALLPQADIWVKSAVIIVLTFILSLLCKPLLDWLMKLPSAYWKKIIRTSEK